MIPSPITWLTVPSYRWTASIISSSTGSRSFRASSGSRSASNSIDPFRSAKRTVTCLRSPSSAAFEVRIFSARCLGVYASGAGERAVAPVSPETGAPHLLQNLEPAGSETPQEAQVKTKRAPHARQKFDSGGLACWQLGHVMPGDLRARTLPEQGSASLVRRDQAIKSSRVGE